MRLPSSRKTPLLLYDYVSMSGREASCRESKVQKRGVKGWRGVGKHGKLDVKGGGEGRKGKSADGRDCTITTNTATLLFPLFII